MTFQHTFWLYAAAIAAAFVVGVYIWAARRRRRDLADFASARLLPNLSRTVSPAKIFIKNALFLLGVVFVFIALARPQWGYRWEETKMRGIDIVFAIDTSKSMLAEDVKPNRLERAKLAVLDLVNALHTDRIGLVAFSGQAFLQCPLTLDYDAFRMSLEALDTEIIRRGGTNIAAAIDEAEAAFGDTSNRKIIVLISDGEELEASALKKAKEAAERDVTIYTLGVGGSKGENIPVRDAHGNLTLLRDEQGNLVKSALNEETLTQIAEATGGFYEPLSADGMDIIYTEGLQKIPQQELSSRMKQLAIERFQIPLAIAIVLIALEALIGTRRFFVRKNAIIPALALAFILPANVQKLRAQEAEELPRDVFNQGLDFYKEGEFAKAKESFTRAMKMAPDDFALHAKALYNMGDAEYRLLDGALAKVKSPDELGDKGLQLSSGADQMLNAGGALLQQGQGLLKEEQKAVAAAKTEEEKQQALAKSPLKEEQFQQQLKQAISQCDNIAKESESVKKELADNAPAWAAAQKVAQSAQKNFASALALMPDFADAKKNLEAAETADKNISNEIDKNKNALDMLSDKAFEFKLEDLAKLKEELKKLLRDDNQQQDNQQQQQNQDQQNQQNQDQKRQDQNKDQQQNQDNQSSQDQKENEQENQDQKDRQNQEDNQQGSDQQNQDEKEQEKDQQKDKQDQGGQDEQKEEQQDEQEKQDQKDRQSGKDNQQQEQEQNKQKDQQQGGEDKQDEQAVAPEEKEGQDKGEQGQPEGEEQKESPEEQAAAAGEEEAAEKEGAEEVPVSPETGGQEEAMSEDYRSAAGVMTRGEAKQLLDSMKNSEKILPIRGYGEQKDRFEKSYKDW